MTPLDAATLKTLGDDQRDLRAEMESKWGVGRLPRLVALEWREKFERQHARWLIALEEAYEAQVLTGALMESARDEAKRMTAAWRKLDALATSAGESELQPDVWEVALSDGTVAAFCRTDADAAAVTRAGRAMSTWTPQEIANVLQAAPELLRAAKVHFPGATVVTSRRKGKMDGEQPIPF